MTDAGDLQRSIARLDVDECLALLGHRVVGRVAFICGDGPVIVPVNYLLDEGTVVFRTTYGTTLDTIGSGARVAFEVDAIDEATHSGWSVVVAGKAEEIWRPEELERARNLPLQPWAPGDRAHYVRILPSSISGRRID